MNAPKPLSAPFLAAVRPSVVIIYADETLLRKNRIQAKVEQAGFAVKRIVSIDTKKFDFSSHDAVIVVLQAHTRDTSHVEAEAKRCSIPVLHLDHRTSHASWDHLERLRSEVRPKALQAAPVVMPRPTDDELEPLRANIRTLTAKLHETEEKLAAAESLLEEAAEHETSANIALKKQLAEVEKERNDYANKWKTLNARTAKAEKAEGKALVDAQNKATLLEETVTALRAELKVARKKEAPTGPDLRAAAKALLDVVSAGVMTADEALSKLAGGK